MKTRWLAWALAAASLPAGADETATRVRAAAAKGQEATFTLRALITIDVQGQTREGRVEVPAMVLDASGLLVAPNPEAGVPANLNVSTKGYRLITADGKESEAKVVGRDADFGLVFLRLTENKEALKAAAPPPAADKAAELGDEVLVVRKLSASHPDPVCELARVTSVVQKPRLMYLLSEAAGPGCAALSGEGNLLGLTVVVQERDPDSGRATNMLVVLPIAQVVEAAKGIREDFEEAPKKGSGPKLELQEGREPPEEEEEETPESEEEEEEEGEEKQP